MEKSTTIVNEGLNLGQELNAALRKISNVVTEVYKFAQEIGSATNEQSNGSAQIARATTRLNEITHEINSAVEEQASGAQAVVLAMERMRELVQSSTSSSTEPPLPPIRCPRCHAVCWIQWTVLLCSPILEPTILQETIREATTTGRRAGPPPAHTGRASQPGPRRLDRVKETPFMNQEKHIVGFRVGHETYGVPIALLHEIVRVPQITAVPDAPVYLEGVINLRGKLFR